MDRLLLLVFCVAFILMILVSFILFYYSGKMYNEYSLLIKNGIITKAVVVDVGKKYVELPKYSGYVYKPILEYSDLENNKVRFAYNTTTHSTSIRHYLGDSLDIVYYADQPHSERENSFQGLYLLPFFLLLMGILFFSAGLVGSVYFWRNKNLD